MSDGEWQQPALVPTQTTALINAGATSLAARGRNHLRDKEEAEEWLRKGLELQEAAPPDPWSQGSLNPYAIRTLANKLQTTIPAYIERVLAGTLPDVAAKSLNMTPYDQEMAHVAHFFMPEGLDRVAHGPTSGEAQDAQKSGSSEMSPMVRAVPSPAGMDDGVLSQETLEKCVRLGSEIDELMADEERKVGQLRKRESTLREAFQYFERGHKLDPNNCELLCQLAESYRRGSGDAVNEARAVELFQRAADMGYARAQTAIGDAHAQCGFGCLPRDDEQAAKWYQAAAEQGDEEALCMLGSIRQSGEEDGEVPS